MNVEQALVNIYARAQLYSEGKGMGTIAAKLNRSAKTIHDHIKDHNASVVRSGFCLHVGR